MPYVGSLLTPSDTLPNDAVVYRVFNNVPVEWQSLIDGILSSFTDGKYWVQDGTLTADESASQLDELVVRWMLSDLCEAIADCINNSAVTQQALNDYLRQNNLGGDTGAGSSVPISGYNDWNLIGGVSCNQDTLFAIAVQIVNWLDQTVVDTLEKIELLTTWLEVAAIVADSIPVLGDSTEFIDWMYEQVSDSYNAGITQALKDQVACDIYCMMWNDCQLTYDELVTYVVSKAGISLLPATTLDGLVTELVTLTDPELIVYATWGLVLGANAVGAVWEGSVNSSTFAMLVERFANDSDPDWAILCAPCVSANTVTFDATGYSLYSFVDIYNRGYIGYLYAGFGNPSPSARVANAGLASVRIEVVVEIDLQTDQTITDVYFDYWYTFSQPTEVLAREIILYDASYTELRYTGASASPGSKATWHTYNSTGATNNVRYIRAVISVGTISNGDGYIDNIRWLN